jgi:hypothetical protein
MFNFAGSSEFSEMELSTCDLLQNIGIDSESVTHALIPSFHL